MTRVTVIHNWKDGNFAEEFAEMGYPAEWLAGESRDLSDSFIKRVVANGGIVTFAESNAKESAIAPVVLPTIPDAEKIARDNFKKEKVTTVIFPEGFKDGTLGDEFSAIDHPAEVGVNEIISLPNSLLRKIKDRGGFFTADFEAIDAQKTQQVKHEQRTLEWSLNREKQARLLLAGKETQKNNAKILAEIESLSAEYVKATGKSKEALWVRIADLRKQIK